eukprot:8283500-Pyramimonas_sp.AAC.2
MRNLLDQREQPLHVHIVDLALPRPVLDALDERGGAGHGAGVWEELPGLLAAVGVEATVRGVVEPLARGQPLLEVRGLGQINQRERPRHVRQKTPPRLGCNAENSTPASLLRAPCLQHAQVILAPEVPVQVAQRTLIERG